MEFRRLTVKDLDSYFANRLRALENAPSAFLTTLAEQKERGTAFLKETLSHSGDDHLIFGALENGEVIGTIGMSRSNRPKLEHKAMIWGMHVDEKFRGHGIGARLLDLALHHAKEKMRADAVFLSVESQNPAARALYESRGFRCWGTQPKAWKHDGRFYNEDHMALEF